MRQIPELSTDLLYSPFPREELIELGNALGVSDIKVVTTATQTADQVFFHTVLNGIQTYMRLGSANEYERGREISEIAKNIYRELVKQFNESVAAREIQLQAEKERIHGFCINLARVEDANSWDAEQFDTIWNSNDFPARWQKKALETYKIIRNQVETGKYIVPENVSIGSYVSYWSLRNHEYKSYRDAGRKLVEAHIEKAFPQQLLSFELADQRLFAMFIGCMGSGKTALTNEFLNSLPEQLRNNIVLHNADFLKPALYEHAVEQGIIPAGHIYTGAEVQSASSNALYEGTRKRGFMARQNYSAPNTIINSIVLGWVEMLEGIAGRGKVQAHHINMDPGQTIAEGDGHASRGKRVISAHDINWSTSASAQSLLNLAEPAFRKANVDVYLYHRDQGAAPVCYGVISASKREVYIADTEKFAKLGATAFQHMKAEEAARAYADKLLNAGFKFSRFQENAIGGAIYAAR